MGSTLPLPNLAGVFCGCGFAPRSSALFSPCLRFADSASPRSARTPPPDAELTADKPALRKQFQEAGKPWNADWRQQASQGVCERLLILPEIQAGDRFALFAPLADEVDIVPLILAAERRGLPVLFPRFNRATGTYDMVWLRDFQQETFCGHYQVREPRPELPAVGRAELAERRLTWLVPGVAFDRSGVRLGRGRGYYDRLLAGTQGVKIGVGFSWRLSDLPLPCGERDVHMDLVVTEREVVRVQPGTRYF